MISRRELLKNMLYGGVAMALPFVGAPKRFEPTGERFTGVDYGAGEDLTTVVQGVVDEDGVYWVTQCGCFPNGFMLDRTDPANEWCSMTRKAVEEARAPLKFGLDFREADWMPEDGALFIDRRNMPLTTFDFEEWARRAAMMPIKLSVNA